MSTYSLEGYLVALRMRGGRNLLVEGKTDLKFMGRLISELEHQKMLLDRNAVTVDPVDLIDDNVLPASRREAVELIYDRASHESLPLAAIVDREFRGFGIGDEVEDRINGHHYEAQLFWTRGHSIENYLFDARYVEAYLRMRYPEEIAESRLAVMRKEFPGLLLSSAALSLAAYKSHFLERCEGLCRQDMWKYSPKEGLSLDAAALAAALTGRGVNSPLAAECADYYERYYRILTSSPDGEIRRWVSHGHLGWEALWSGVAKVLSDAGVSPSIAEAVSHGFKEDKIRFLADSWAREALAGGAVAPPELMSWMVDAA